MRKLHNSRQQFKWYQTCAQTQRIIIVIIYRKRVLTIEHIDFPVFFFFSSFSSLSLYFLPTNVYCLVLFIVLACKWHKWIRRTALRRSLLYMSQSPFRRHGLLFECLQRRPLDFLGLFLLSFIQLSIAATTHRSHRLWMVSWWVFVCVCVCLLGHTTFYVFLLPCNNRQ